MNNKVWKKIGLVLTWLAVFQLQAGAQGSLQQQFTKPSEEAKPWTFWYWMFGAVSEEGIKADLEAMKEVGLGGAYLMPI